MNEFQLTGMNPPPPPNPILEGKMPPTPEEPSQSVKNVRAAMEFTAASILEHMNNYGTYDGPDID